MYIYHKLCHYTQLSTNMPFLWLSLSTRIIVWNTCNTLVHVMETEFLYCRVGNWLTYLLTPWSRVLLEKLTDSAASKEIPRIFGTRMFITVLTSARHLSLSWTNSIQSPQSPPTSWRSILILSSCLRLGLPSCLFPSGFLTRTLYTSLPCHIRATCPAHLILFDFTTRTIFGRE